MATQNLTPDQFMQTRRPTSPPAANLTPDAFMANRTGDAPAPESSGGVFITAARPRGFWDRVTDVFTEGALGQLFGPPKDPVLAALDKTAMPAARQPVLKLSELDRQGEARDVGEGVRLGLLEGLEGWTSPEGIAMIASLGKLGRLRGIGRALAASMGAGFDADMILGAVEQVPEAKALWDAGKQGEAARAAVRSLLTGGLGAVGAVHKTRTLKRATPLAERPLSARERAALGEQIAGMGTKRLKREAKLRPPAAAAVLAEEVAARKARSVPQVETPPPTDPGPRLSRAQRRASVKPPETGEPEAAARLADARENLARELTGKPVKELAPDEFMVVDKYAREGYGSAKPVETPVAAPEKAAVKTEAVPKAETTPAPTETPQPPRVAFGEASKAPAKPAGILEKLDAAGKEASKRLRARGVTAGSRYSANEILNPATIRDMATAIAGDVARGALTVEQLGARLAKEYGPRARLMAQKVWAEVQKVLKDMGHRFGSERGSIALLPGKPGEQAAPAGAGKKPVTTATATPAPEKPGLTTSPSYEKTKHKILEKVEVPEDERTELARRMTAWEAEHPERRAVTFEDIRAEARALDPTLVLHLKRPKPGETLDPALRYAAREMLNGLNEQIVKRRKDLAAKQETADPTWLLDEERRIGEMEKRAQGLLDVLIPTRSQDGRNLAYHRMMAEKSFDVEYWVARAKRAAGGALDPAAEQGIRETLAEGQAAERAAVERARGGGAEAERPAGAKRNRSRVTAARGPEQNRAWLVEQKHKELIARLKAAIAGEKTAKVDPVSPEERAAWESDPEVLRLRADLAKVRAEKGAAARQSIARAQIVEQKRKQFIARLRSQAKGKLVTVDPVSAEERALWERDPEVLALRAKIAANRLPKVPPTSEQKVERGVQRTLKTIEQKARGETRQPGPGALTPEERAAVANDPRVKAARVALARQMAKLERTGLLDTITALRRAGLLTGVKTHARNVVGNLSFQVLEETARIPGVILDAGIGMFSGRRMVSTPDPRAVAKASYAAATRGLREAREIMRKGATEDELAKMDMRRELNSGSKVIDAYVNTVFRTMAAEDRVFKVYAYERSLAEQMKLAKVKAPTEAMRAQAIADALFATFNNPNLIAEGLKGAKQRLAQKGGAGRAAAFAIDMAVPFQNTPANIISRVIDYSGGGVVRGGVGAIRAAMAKALTPEQQRAISMSIGRGLTGPALIYMGWMLADAGLMTGTRPEEPGAAGREDAAGRPSGAVQVGGRWLQVAPFSPAGNLLTIGATLQRESTRPLKDEAKRPANVAKVATRTVMEQPMLKGVQDVTEGLMQPGKRMERAVGATAGSFVPTLISDVAGLGDTKRRDTGADSTLGAVANAIKARVPGLRRTLPERVDALGKAEDQLWTQAFDPTLSKPARELKDPVLREMVKQQVSLNKVQRKQGEGAEEHRLRQIITGRVIEARMREVVENPEYRELPELKTGDESRKLVLERAIAKARAEVNRLVSHPEFKAMDEAGRTKFLRGLVAPD